jgi:hypothetical protein
MSSHLSECCYLACGVVYCGVAYCAVVYCVVACWMGYSAVLLYCAVRDGIQCCGVLCDKQERVKDKMLRREVILRLVAW